MTKRLIPFIVLCFLLTNLSAQTKQTSAADDYSAIFKALKWRSIGPFRGGRSNCAAGVVGDPKTYYMGTTGGGLWKMEDMGISWRNVSDGFFKTGSVGAVAVAESDPKNKNKTLVLSEEGARRSAELFAKLFNPRRSSEPGPMRQLLFLPIIFAAVVAFTLIAGGQTNQAPSPASTRTVSGQVLQSKENPSVRL